LRYTSASLALVLLILLPTIGIAAPVEAQTQSRVLMPIAYPILALRRLSTKSVEQFPAEVSTRVYDISVKVGEVGQVRLDTNPSTGSEWWVESAPEAVDISVSSDINPAIDCGTPPRPGCSNQVAVYSFSSDTPGYYTIELRYGHPWAHNEYYEVAIVNLTVINNVTPVCSEGAVNVLETCPDGQTWSHRQVCRNNAWVDEYQQCPATTTHPSGEMKFRGSIITVTSIGQSAMIVARIEEVLETPTGQLKPGDRAYIDADCSVNNCRLDLPLSPGDRIEVFGAGMYDPKLLPDGTFFVHAWVGVSVPPYYVIKMREGYYPPADGFSFDNNAFMEYAGAAPYPTLQDIVDILRRYPEASNLPGVAIYLLAWTLSIAMKPFYDKDGYCYGMSKASIDYFESGVHAHDSITKEQAGTNIKNNQLSPSDFVDTSLKWYLVFRDLTTNEKELQKIGENVSPNSPKIVLAYPDPVDLSGHALVAYEVKKDGADTTIYVYDPNTKGNVQKLTLDTNSVLSYDGPCLGSDCWVPSRLAYHQSAGEILGEVIQDIFKQGRTVAFVAHSPVEIAVANDAGQYVGVKDGRLYQEFPATYLSNGEDKIIVISGSLGRNYRVVLTATGTGLFTLESLSIVNGKTSEAKFQGSVSQGQSLFYGASIEPSGELTISQESTTTTASQSTGTLWTLDVIAALVSIALALPVVAAAVLLVKRRKALPSTARKSPIYTSKFCVQCGSPLRAGSNFCLNCGTRTRQATRTPP
jgi:hypothetical protein